MTKPFIQPGLYQHYKGPYYQVIDTVTHSESLETHVLYRPLYGDFALWVRPIDLFCEHISSENGIKARFEFVAAELPEPWQHFNR